ncbi:TPA: tyrosine-type recombinase/integrase [Photobacterium damselae]
MAKLTQEWIDKYQPKSNPVKCSDPQCRGLFLIFRPSGYHSYLLDFTSQGVRYNLTLGNTQTLSLAKARELAYQERAKRDPKLNLHAQPQKPILFDEFGQSFLIHQARVWKPRTITWYDSLFQRNLLPAFQGLTLDKITTDNVKVWYGTQSHHGALALLSNIMKKAEALGYIPAGSNPCKGLRQPRQRLTGYALTSQELAQLWRALDNGTIHNPTLTRLIRLLVLTGCRCGELRNVKQCDYRMDKLYFPDSKTGTKTIYLSSFARYWLQEQQQESTNEYIFSDELGGIKRGRLTQAWKTLRQSIGLPHIRMHDLRHTYATRALENGEHLLNVGKLLGHELPETTLRYAHLASAPMYHASECVSQTIAREMRP